MGMGVILLQNELSPNSTSGVQESAPHSSTHPTIWPTPHVPQYQKQDSIIQCLKRCWLVNILKLLFPPSGLHTLYLQNGLCELCPHMLLVKRYSFTRNKDFIPSQKERLIAELSSLSLSPITCCRKDNMILVTILGISSTKRAAVF